MGLIDPLLERAQIIGTDGLDKLRIFIEHYVLLMAGDFSRCLVLSRTTPLEQASCEELAPSFRRIDSAVRAMVAEGVRGGSIAPCDPNSPPSRCSARCTGSHPGTSPRAR